MPFDYGKFTNGEYDKYFSADIFHLTEKRGPDKGNGARPQKSWKYIFSNLTGRIASKFRRSTICQGIASIFTKKSNEFSDLQQFIGKGKRIKNSNFLSAIENDKNFPKDAETIEKITKRMEVFGANKEQVTALRNKATASPSEASNPPPPSNPPLPVSQIPKPLETIKHIPLNQIRMLSNALKEPKYALILEFIHLCSSTLPPQTLKELSEQSICPHLAEVLNSYHSLLAGKTSVHIFVQSLNNNIKGIIDKDLDLPYDQEFSAAVCIQKVYEKHNKVHPNSYPSTTIQGTTQGDEKQPGRPRAHFPVILTQKTLQEEFQAFASNTIDSDTIIKTSFNTPPKEWWVAPREKNTKQQNILGDTLQHTLPASCLPDGTPATYQCDHIECTGEDGMPYSYRRLADDQWQRSDGRLDKLLTDVAVLEATKEKGISFHLTLVTSPSAAPPSQPVSLNPGQVPLSNNSPAANSASPPCILRDQPLNAPPYPHLTSDKKIDLTKPWRPHPSPKIYVEFRPLPCALNVALDWISQDEWTLNALHIIQNIPHNPFPLLTKSVAAYLQAQNGELSSCEDIVKRNIQKALWTELGGDCNDPADLIEKIYSSLNVFLKKESISLEIGNKTNWTTKSFDPDSTKTKKDRQANWIALNFSDSFDLIFKSFWEYTAGGRPKTCTEPKFDKNNEKKDWQHVSCEYTKTPQQICIRLTSLKPSEKRTIFSNTEDAINPTFTWNGGTEKSQYVASCIIIFTGQHHFTYTKIPGEAKWTRCDSSSNNDYKREIDKNELQELLTSQSTAVLYKRTNI